MPIDTVQLASYFLKEQGAERTVFSGATANVGKKISAFIVVDMLGDAEGLGIEITALRTERHHGQQLNERQAGVVRKRGRHFPGSQSLVRVFLPQLAPHIACLAVPTSSHFEWSISWNAWRCYLWPWIRSLWPRPNNYNPISSAQERTRKRKETGQGAGIMFTENPVSDAPGRLDEMFREHERRRVSSKQWHENGKRRVPILAQRRAPAQGH